MTQILGREPNENIVVKASDEVKIHFPQFQSKKIVKQIVSISGSEEQIPEWYFDTKKFKIKRFLYDWYRWFFPFKPKEFDGKYDVDARLTSILVPVKDYSWSGIQFVKNVIAIKDKNDKPV